MVNNLLKNSSMERSIFMLLMLLAIARESENLAWNRWHWTFPHEPNTGLFRRSNDESVKTQGSPCQCPPSKECEIEFKPNDAAVDFLKLRGVLNEEQVMDIKEDFEIQNMTTTVEVPVRRAGDDGDNCCCPPRTIMMPTFITSKEFEEAAGVFQV